MGMARAGGLNYEGFSSYKGYGDDVQTRGAMLNFSFGGPKDYKKNESLQDIYEASMTSSQKAGIGMSALLVTLYLVITQHDDDDECSTTETMVSAASFALSEFDPCRPFRK